jgi:hypothetical protein
MDTTDITASRSESTITAETAEKALTFDATVSITIAAATHLETLLSCPNHGLY